MHFLWVAICLSVLTPMATASGNFTYDGSSSDMAQQFYNMHESDSFDESALQSLSLAKIPVDLQKRLDAHKLKFEYLSPLLQRAVVWDSGYVAQFSNESYLTTIYTPCDKALTMADIALSLQEYEASGCPTKNCTPADSLPTYRSYNCPSTQMAPQSLCASTDMAAMQNTAMWATGGNDSMLPVPRVVRHDWWVPNDQTGAHYLMFAIHMVQGVEADYEACPFTPQQSAMIIPCVPYENSTKSDWCRPSTGLLVESWLSRQPPSPSGTKTSGWM